MYVKVDLTLIFRSIVESIVQVEVSQCSIIMTLDTVLYRVVSLELHENDTEWVSSLDIASEVDRSLFNALFSRHLYFHFGVGLCFILALITIVP